MLWTCAAVSAQVRGKIAAMESSNHYMVSIVSSQTWAPPNSITNTAILTLKVPTGEVQITDIESHLGTWELSSTINAPVEAPAFDYLVFTLSSPLTTVTYQENVDTPLFSFTNSGECTIDLQILDSTNDPFLPPNSLNANIGNQFTILGNGTGNAYQGTIETNYATTPCNSLSYSFDYFDPSNDRKKETLACAGDSLKASLVFLEGVAPLYIVLRIDEVGSFFDTLHAIGDTAIMPMLIPSGSHTLFLIDSAPDTVWHPIELEEPTPLDVRIIYKEDITCNDKDGALVQLQPKGIQSDQTYEFRWSTGHLGDIVEGLQPGNYRVTLTNSRGCSTTKEIKVNGIPPITIEEKLSVHPSCPGIEDGAITIDVKGGVGIQYFYEWEDPDLPKQWDLTGLPGGQYSVTVYDISGCVSSKEINLNIPPPIEPKITATDPSCPDFEDGAITLVANEDGALPFKYSINDGVYKGQTEYTDLKEDTYVLSLIDARNCRFRDTIFLEDPEEFAVELGEDREIYIGQTERLIEGEEVEGPYQFEWFPSESLDCDDCPNPMAKPHGTTTYSVVITNEAGCYRSDEVTISVNLDRPIFFPTAFSPNGDGNNDYFEIPHGITTTSIVRLRMFNRWGQLVYDSELYSAGMDVKWDGNFENKPLNEGVYIYAADVLFDDGKVLPYHGDVLLVR